MKILNLYCGIGGNRELWGDDHEIVSVEIIDKIAKKYKSRFPNDKVIVGDAHEYLLRNFKKFDFIWGSPPCPEHSRTNYFTQSIQKNPTYPDMKLWQEIVYLKQFCKSTWVIENVIPYYDPFLPNYTKIGRHLFWSNFKIPLFRVKENEIGSMDKGYNRAYKKSREERNAVDPELGLHILNSASSNCIIRKGKHQYDLFSNL